MLKESTWWQSHKTQADAFKLNHENNYNQTDRVKE